MKNFFKRIDDFFFGHLQMHYARSLEKECEGYESLLDIGCGSDSPVKLFSKKMKRVTGIDGFQPSIDKARAAGIHTEYYLMNVMDVAEKFPPHSFDVV
ncbi:MAG TPA: methyltransferase domain-containing protein, partial [Bacteroidia bacterium]|nr:methyltransferase domain-containing protein [Bacteroidia bacterium]